MKPVATRVKAIAPSPTVRLGILANELRAQGKDVVNLSVGEPDFPTPAHVVVAAQKAMDDIAMTKQAVAAGDLLDIEVADHVILAHGRFASMKTLKVGFS